MKPDRIGTALLVLVTLAACTSVEVVARKPHVLPEPHEPPAAPATQAELAPATRMTPPPRAERLPPAVTAAQPPSPPAARAPQPIAPQAPFPVTSCDPGGCWSSGQRYNGGAGGTYLDKSGKLCQRNGSWMQCF